MKKNRKKDVRRADVVTSVQVAGEGQPRKVFYARRELIFDAHGRVCHSPVEAVQHLAEHVCRRDEDAVLSVVSDLLYFIYGGELPRDIGKRLRNPHGKPVPLLV